MQKKKVTIQDIANQANVSKSTVSRVLNKSSLVKEHKRKAVLEAMEELDFQPNQMARTLAGGRSMTIGILTQNIGSPFYDVVALGVTNGLKGTDYFPILADGQWSADVEEAAIDTLLDRRVDGIILIGGDMPPEDVRQIQERKPLIVTAREIDGWNSDCIFIDNFKAAYEATNYLIREGHREIAFVSGVAGQQDSQRRQQGFRQAMKDSGITLNPKLCVKGDFGPSSGFDAMEKLLDQGVEFTAIFCSNDEMAFGARLSLFRRGVKVPDEVSIIGFDDQPMSAFMTPPLTTVKQPGYELGIAAAKAMVQMLDGEPVSVSDLSTELVIRESVASLK